MNKEVNVLGLGVRDEVFFKSMELDATGVELSWEFLAESDDSNAILKKLESKEFCLLQGPSCYEFRGKVSNRAVDSHFLKYVDFITVHGKKLWGYSIFSKAWKKVILKKIRTQTGKGSVIFLGFNPFAFPVVQILAQLGYKDFVFLIEDQGVDQTEFLSEMTSSLFDVTVSTVESRDFIQSQKEYSMCLVTDDTYSDQSLEDMSYFHFLSQGSLVFDLSGRSNFAFEEVTALGVEVVTYEHTMEVFREELSDFITQSLGR